MKHAALILSIALLIPPAAFAQGYDVSAAMQAYGAAQPTPEELPEIVKLKEADVKGYIKTVAELKALGLKFDKTAAEKGPARTMKAIEANGKAMGIVKKNGFTTDRLSQVAYSIAMAMAASDMDKDAAAKAKAQSAQALEQVRGQLPADQLAMIQQQMGKTGQGDS